MVLHDNNRNSKHVIHHNNIHTIDTKQTMRSFSLQRTANLPFLLTCISLLTSKASSQRIQQCFDQGDIVGYTSIEDINLDMEDIVMNGTITGPYQFTLCPLSSFDVVEPLRPLLSNTTFVCGTGGVGESCTITGGAQQVVLEGDITGVRLFGIDFENFSNASIAASASGNSTVRLEQCRWRVSMPTIYTQSSNQTQESNVYNFFLSYLELCEPICRRNCTRRPGK